LERFTSMEPRIQIQQKATTGDGARRDPNEMINGYAYSYLRLCRGQGYNLTSQLEPVPCDWILGENIPDDMRLAGDPPGELSDGEVVVPSLSRLVHLLRAEAHSVVVDCYPDDFACMAFDEGSFSLANVVSRNPEEAALRALLFILSERAANEIRGS
jgi:hypothetical protein